MNCPRSRLRIRQMAADTCDTETTTRGYLTGHVWTEKEKKKRQTGEGE
jgi:hypothetical protein